MKRKQKQATLTVSINIFPNELDDIKMCLNKENIDILVLDLLVSKVESSFKYRSSYEIPFARIKSWKLTEK